MPPGYSSGLVLILREPHAEHFMCVPINGTGHAEGGLIVPLALALPHKFGLGLNGGVVWVRSDATTGYHAEYLASASLAHEWTEKLGTYYEVAATLDTDDPRGDIVVLGTGITYAATDNIQLDAGVNVGVTSAADRINPFVGLSTRF